jgi:hypothetical protein
MMASDGPWDRGNLSLRVGGGWSRGSNADQIRFLGRPLDRLERYAT